MARRTDDRPFFAEQGRIMKRKGLCIYLFILLTIVGFLVRWQQVCRLQAEQEACYGLFTGKQILERTDALCPLVWPQIDHFTLTADKATLYRGEIPSLQAPSVPRRVWFVSCQNAEGTIEGQFCWNADTGDLILLGAKRRNNPDAMELEQSELHRLSRQWLWKMGLCQKAERWQLSHVVPDRSAHNIMFTWRSHDRQANILLKNNTGQLVILSVK
jgi:hypothetical protein